MMRVTPYDLGRCGFTLVELALVLTVVGLLLTFGTSAWMSMKTSQQISAAETALKTASSCLSNYVIHSGKTPPQAYFTRHCRETDPWGEDLLYYNNGDGLDTTIAPTKVVRDSEGDHPDAIWLVVSSGINTTIETSSSATLWDCSGGDDLCHFVTKSELIYERNR